MAVLTDNNLILFKQSLDNFEASVRNWYTYLSCAKNALNDNVGATFRTEYAKGKKAGANIQSVIDILVSAQEDLEQLAVAAHEFLDKSWAAQKN